MFLESHDGAPAVRTSFNDRCVDAALEHTYLCAGLIKTKEDLLGSATTDDDEIGDIIDTVCYFTEKTSEENHLDQVSWGRDMVFNERIRTICRRLPTIFSGSFHKKNSLRA